LEIWTNPDGFDLYVAGDYKRCICKNWGNGEEDCEFVGEAPTPPEPLPFTPVNPNDLELINEVSEMFKNIRENKHNFDDNEPSRTNHQTI